MFNATSLLGGLLQQLGSPSARGRIGEALGQMAPGGSAQGSPLGGLLGRLGGAGGPLGNLLRDMGGGDMAPGERREELMRLARDALASPRAELANNNPLAVGGLGALAGTLLGGGRGAVGGGLLAVLGSLAWSALRGGGGPAAATAAPESGGYGRPGEVAMPATPEDVDRMALLVLRAMIQAAKADGQIDQAEIERITGKAAEADPDSADAARGFVLEQMRGPADLAGLARDVRSPVEAAEVYAAALMAIEVDTEAERDFLARLAGALGLQPETVARLHEGMGLARPTTITPPRA